ILVIRRPLARRQPRLRLAGHVFLEYLPQPRFANARLAAQQHHLARAVLDLRPALPQEPHLLLSTYERGQASAAGRFQATAGHTLIQYLIDFERLRDVFQEWGP